MTKEQRKAFGELIIGLVLGVPSIEEIFFGIFLNIFKSGNKLAIIGLITAALVGVVMTADSIAKLFGFKNLGSLLRIFEDEEE